MPEIKKVLLQKSISGTLYDIFPKTDSSIVMYTKSTPTQENPNATTEVTVAAELASLAAKIVSDSGSLKDDLEQQIKDLEDKIYGLGDGDTLDAAFDTIKEINDWLKGNEEGQTAATILSRLANTEDDLGKASAAAVGTPGEEGYKEAVAASGLHADVESNTSRIVALENIGAHHVEDSDTNGYIKVGNATTGAYTEIEVYNEGTDAVIGSNFSVTTAGTGLKGRISNNENDIDKLEAAVGEDATIGADFAVTDNGSGVKGRLKIAENDIDKLEAAVGDDDTNGTVKGRIKALETEVGDDDTDGTVKGRIKDIEDQEDKWNTIVTYVPKTGTAPTDATAAATTLYMIEL